MPSRELRLPVHVRDLTLADLPWIGWAGGPEHPRYVEEALSRTVTGEVEYLALCGPADLPMAIGGIDYALRAGGGTLWQLATTPQLQSCGLGTMLIQAAEERILARGLDKAYLAVDEGNVRAIALYLRSGYTPYDVAEESWDVRDGQGRTVHHSAKCLQMQKSL